MILEAMLAVNKMSLKVRRLQDLFKRQTLQTRASFSRTVHLYFIFKKGSKDAKLKQFALSGLEVNCVLLQEYPTCSF